MYVYGVCVQQIRPVASGRARVVVLGMDGAGKTSLLRGLASGCLERDTEPKEAFRTFAIDKDDLHMEFLESKSELSKCHHDSWVHLKHRVQVFEG